MYKNEADSSENRFSHWLNALFSFSSAYTLTAHTEVVLLEKWVADMEKMEMDGTICAEQQTSCP